MHTAHLSRFCRVFLLIFGLWGGVAGARATTVNPPEFAELVNGSDYVVRAVVKSVRAEMTVLPNGRQIHTFVELDVLEVIAGNPPSPLVLRVLGGKVGDDEMILQGAPKFTVGEESILFVRGNGRMAFPLLGIMHGYYPIKRIGKTDKYVARSDGVPLESATDVCRALDAGQMSEEQKQSRATRALTPDQFARQIRETVKKPAERED